VARIRIGIEEIEACHETDTEGIQMNITDQFEQVRLLFAEYGFVAVLKEVVGPLVALVERNGVAGKKASHDVCNRHGPGPEHKMDVIRKQGEGIAGCLLFGDDVPNQVEKTVLVGVVVEDRTPRNASHHHVVDSAGSVDAGMSGHRGMVPGALRRVKTI